MAETRSREEIAAAALVTAVTAGVVMAGMSDGNALTNGLVGAGAALVAWACFTLVYGALLFWDQR